MQKEYAMWGAGVGGVALFGYATFYFLSEGLRATRSSKGRTRQPWELE